MKYMPEFRFRLDTSYDNFARIDELLRSPEVARDLGNDDREDATRTAIMARRGKKKGRPVSGWVVLDKPVGMGSTEAVSKVKWLFQADKAGHAGTLDPLASGMLPIALGEATKTVPYVMDGAKIYRFTVAWGEERSTDDLEGPVTQTLRPAPGRGRRSARCCPNTPASSCRRRRNSRRSRSPAPAPMIWRATARRSTFRRARSRSAAST